MKFPLRQVDIPEGETGRWKVERFTVTPKDAEANKLFAIIQSVQGRRTISVPAGNYTKLRCGGAIIMSDTPSEMYDHIHFVRRAKGQVLIAGLGIGMVLQAALDSVEVEHVTVIEKAGEVIQLVAPTFQKCYGDRLEVIHADIFTWSPPRGIRWDVGWFDIWPTKCTDNLKEITQLKRRFARRCDWRGFWVEEDLRHQQRQNRSWVF